MIVSKSGFPSETHVVTTSDGYILEVHRIPHAPTTKNANSSSSANRPVVFLQHGLLSSSADWVLEGTEKGLGINSLFSWKDGGPFLYKQLSSLYIHLFSEGFILAENGYDVWMGNYRGNSYSRNHLTLDPDEFDFWKFRYTSKCIPTQALILDTAKSSSYSLRKQTFLEKPKTTLV